MVVSRGLFHLSFHLGCGLFYVYGTYYDMQIVTENILIYGGRLKYLTFVNLLCQLIYFSIAPCADILTLLKGHEDNWLVRLRDTMFCALAFPLGVFVSATFWGIYMIDRNLIFPVAMDAIIPPWLNHLLHTWSAVFVIIEGAFIRHKYPRNRVGLGLLASFGVAYLIWIMWIAYVAEFWVYPFLRIMPNSFRAAFFSMSFCILFFLYFLGKWMTLFIWRDGEEQKSTNSNPKQGAKKKVKQAD